MKAKQLVKVTAQEALDFHVKARGKIEVTSKVPCKTFKDLSLAYTPGVAEPCQVIAKDRNSVYKYTNIGNLVGVVTDGSAVLGLGDIGPSAGMPVMEGKCVLFKSFAGVDAFPICLDVHEAEEIVEATRAIAPTFGGINLEDIKAPKCFYIEDQLKKSLDIPVFHDDQHGTAVIVLGGMINALKLVGKKLEETRIVINGAGAAGNACAKILLSLGVKDIILMDRTGAIYEGRKEGMNPYKEDIAKLTNREQIEGGLIETLKGADVFLGLSAANCVSQDMVRSMGSDPVIFALANPDPEILPNLAEEAGAALIATGRSDFPNQLNNVLGFPGIFRGALDVRAKDINEEMKLQAGYALAGIISDDELTKDYIISKPMDPRVVPEVAAAVAGAALKSGVARIKISKEEIRERTRKLMEISD